MPLSRALVGGFSILIFLTCVVRQVNFELRGKGIHSDDREVVFGAKDINAKTAKTTTSFTPPSTSSFTTPLIPSSTTYPAGFNVTKTNYGGETELHRAINRGDGAAVCELVRMGADVNAMDRYNFTSLHKAAHQATKTCEKSNYDASCLGVIDFLVEHGADVKARNYAGNTFLHILLGHSDNTIIPSQLHQIVEKYGHLFNFPNRQKITPLHYALCWVKFDISSLSLLHEKEVDFTMVDHQNKTVLAYAVAGLQDVAVLSKLIEFGADYKQLNTEGWSLLHLASFHGHADVLAYFIRKGGLEVSGLDEMGRTPLHWAGSRYSADFKPLKIVNLLLGGGADKTIKDRDGRTAYDVIKMGPSISDEDKILELLRVIF